VIPLYGFLRGDTIGLLILARAEDTVATLAERLQSSAAVRVAHTQRMAVVFKERILDPKLTVARAGLTPLDRFDLVPLERA
jgi:toluene-4-monooxygenase system protein B